MTNIYDYLDEEHLVTPDEAAGLLDITPQFLRQLIAQGEIPVQPENCAGNDAVILYSDLIAYRDKRNQIIQEGLARMAEINQNQPE